MTFFNDMVPWCGVADPFFELSPGSNHGNSIAGYRANLNVMRMASLRSGVPFWNFFNLEGFGGHPDPTEAQLRWQIFTSLAYGAKGVLYYCYGDAGGACGRGGVLYHKRRASDRNGVGQLSRGRHYGDAQRINSVLRVYGALLLTSVSTGVYRVQPPGCLDTGETGTCPRGSEYCPNGEQPENISRSALEVRPSDVAVSPLEPGNGLLIGEFRLRDGRTAVLLHNQVRSSSTPCALGCDSERAPGCVEFPKSMLLTLRFVFRCCRIGTPRSGPPLASKTGSLPLPCWKSIRLRARKRLCWTTASPLPVGSPWSSRLARRRLGF